MGCLFRTPEYPNLPTLERFADATGKGAFYRLADHGINGAARMDAAVHHGFETVAAAVLAR